MNKIKMIGIGATALVGKDTLFGILDNLFPEKLERVALADPLKAEVNQFCVDKYGISAFTKNPQKKEIIRPIFVAHGKIRRDMTKGTYWTGLAEERVNDIISRNLIPVCTDIRFAVHKEDEVFWLKNKHNGVYVHINRFNKDGSKVEAPNSEEKEQEKILEKHADFRLNWQTSSDINF
jgi:hypothetical protein